MVSNKWLGQKTKQGFYKKVGKDIHFLDHKTLEYKESPKVKFASLEAAKQIDKLPSRLASIAYSDDKAGKFFWAATIDTLVYSMNRIPEISDDIVNVDNAMKWGFGWEMGPFETWDALGVAKSVEKMKAEGRAVPQPVLDMLASGKKSFYEKREGDLYYYDFVSKDYKAVNQPKGFTILSSLKDKGKVIKKNSGASLIDLGDGVACLEFHSKMNSIGGDTIDMLNKSLKEVEENYEGLVIGNQGSNFSAGANIMMVLLSAMEGEWEDIDIMVRAFQKATMSVKYSKKPVVVAPFGLTLGGGCEFTMASPRAVAAAETYIGLVEVGVGLLPGGGGTKEMTIRAMDKMVNYELDPVPYLQPAFETVGMGKVFESAFLAKKGGILKENDIIVMNKDMQIAEAKKAVLALVAEGYQAPQPRNDVFVYGRRALAALKLALYNMKMAGFISEHDELIGTKIAHVMAGGDSISTRRVSEQYLLDLEREAFLSLCGTRKTQERIQHMLKTGKPLRN